VFGRDRAARITVDRYATIVCIGVDAWPTVRQRRRDMVCAFWAEGEHRSPDMQRRADSWRTGDMECPVRCLDRPAGSI
jgi:hypothetical protein